MISQRFQRQAGGAYTCAIQICILQIAVWTRVSLRAVGLPLRTESVYDCVASVLLIGFSQSNSSTSREITGWRIIENCVPPNFPVYDWQCNSSDLARCSLSIRLHADNSRIKCGYCASRDCCRNQWNSDVWVPLTRCLVMQLELLRRLSRGGRRTGSWLRSALCGLVKMVED